MDTPLLVGETPQLEPTTSHGQSKERSVPFSHLPRPTSYKRPLLLTPVKSIGLNGINSCSGAAKLF